MDMKKNYYFFDKTIIANKNSHREELVKEDVKNVIFNECDFRGAFFDECIFENCEFNNCSLITLAVVKSEFINCIFNDCRAFDAYLLQVKLFNCTLLNVNFRLSTFKSVHIKDSVMNCLNLDEGVTFDQVTYNENVAWPKEFLPEKYGLVLDKAD